MTSYCRKYKWRRRGAAHWHCQSSTSVGADLIRSSLSAFLFAISLRFAHDRKGEESWRGVVGPSSIFSSSHRGGLVVERRSASTAWSLVDTSEVFPISVEAALFFLIIRVNSTSSEGLVGGRRTASSSWTLVDAFRGAPTFRGSSVLLLKVEFLLVINLFQINYLNFLSTHK